MLVDAPTASSMISEERHDSELFRVYAAILDAITDRVLLPGKKLTESDLCRQMSCSRNTVRGALSLLAHDHIVDLQPNRGAFVHVPDAKETKDVYELRIALEEMVMDMLLDLPDDELFGLIMQRKELSDVDPAEHLMNEEDLQKAAKVLDLLRSV